MDQTYSFKTRELLAITKNAGTLLYSSVSWNCTQFQGKRASRSGTGARRTWQPIIFTYFASSSPSKFSWYSSFNVAGSTCSFNWCYIFSFDHFYQKYQYRRESACDFTAFEYFCFWSFLLKISIQKEKHVILQLLVTYKKKKNRQTEKAKKRKVRK